MVLDGYGLNDRTEGNAIALANTPVMDKLMKECPFVKGQASGPAELHISQQGSRSSFGNIADSATLGEIVNGHAAFYQQIELAERAQWVIEKLTPLKLH